MLASSDHYDDVVLSALLFREGALFFYSMAGLVGPLVWHIVMTVQAANESKASTLFAGMEAALQGQSFQPTKRSMDMKSH